ncbi:MAG: hypothetical protein WDN45_05580 [Caulobacteraceae bacterium]
MCKLSAEQGLAAANVRAAQTLIASTDAQSAKAEADHRRYDALVSSGAVARRDADQFRAAAVTAQSDADHSRANLDVARSQAGGDGRPSAGAAGRRGPAEAAAARAKAALDLAKQDQGYAVIRAPMDGGGGAIARPRSATMCSRARGC